MSEKKHSLKRSPSLDMTRVDRVIGYRVRRAKNAVYEDFARHLSDLGITPIDFSVLSLIADNPGRPQGQIAEALGITRANFATLIKTLDGRALTMRGGAHERDRRLSLISLTETGQQFVKLARRRQSKLEKQYVLRLGGEQERDLLLELLHRLSSPGAG